MPAGTGTRYRMPRYCSPLRLYFSGIARRTGAIPWSEITAGRVTARIETPTLARAASRLRDPAVLFASIALLSGACLEQDSQLIVCCTQPCASEAERPFTNEDHK
jgi:hypothetical protein